MLTRNLKLLLRATGLLSCLFMLSISAYAWGSIHTNSISSSGTVIYPQSATLLFRSGWEDPVYVSHRGDGQASWLHDADQGYDWDDLSHMFNYVAVDAIGKGYVDTYVSSSKAHSGSGSLYMEVTKDGSVEGTQNRLQFYSDDATFGDEVFIRRWLYWGSISQILTEGINSFSINGVRELAYGSQALSVYTGVRHDGTKLHWRAVCVDYQAGDYWSQWLQWQAFNYVVAIPENKWFLLEEYVYRHPTDGIYKVWVDGESLFPDLANVVTKRHGSTWLGKIADIDVGSTGFNPPMYQYVDDVEVWKDGIPAGTPPEQEDYFGYATKGSTEETNEDYISGSRFTIYDDGTAQSIKAYLKCTTVDKYACGLIYKDSDNSLVGVTEQVLVTAGTDGIVQFNFSIPKPNLVAYTKYILCLWGESGDGVLEYYDDYGDTNQLSYRFETYSYGNEPDPITWTASTAHKLSVWCIYTPLR